MPDSSSAERSETGGTPKADGAAHAPDAPADRAVDAPSPDSAADAGEGGTVQPSDASPRDGSAAHSCAPSCDRCVSGVCCGTGCCNRGEWCDESSGTPTCRCGAGQACVAPNGCNAPVVMVNGCGVICCQGSQCPISRRAYKEDIRYVGTDARQQLYADLLRFRLARYRYKGAAPSTSPRLGFIIDDAPGSPAVNSDGETVDLYAYMSMAVAALQEQARQIERLQSQVVRLRGQSRARGR